MRLRYWGSQNRTTCPHSGTAPPVHKPCFCRWWTWPCVCVTAALELAWTVPWGMMGDPMTSASAFHDAEVLAWCLHKEVPCQKAVALIGPVAQWTQDAGDQFQHETPHRTAMIVRHRGHLMSESWQWQRVQGQGQVGCCLLGQGIPQTPNPGSFWNSTYVDLLKGKLQIISGVLTLWNRSSWMWGCPVHLIEVWKIKTVSN